MWMLTLLLVLASPSVDLNSATDAQLRAAGCSASQAAQILGYRNENGVFRQFEELLAVPQVTPALVAKLRGGLRVAGQSAPASLQTAIAPGSYIALEHAHSEWQNLYGAIVFAATASVHDTGDKPLRAVKVRLELLDASGGIVASSEAWNLAAEALTEKPDALDALKPIAAGGSDPVRLSVDKGDIGRPFQVARLRIVEVQ